MIVAFNTFYLKNRWGGTGSLLPDGLIYDGVSDNPIKVTKVFQVSFILALFTVQKNLGFSPVIIPIHSRGTAFKIISTIRTRPFYPLIQYIFVS